MQYKYIVATIASLAVSTAIANPIVAASPNALEARADQAVQQANAQAAEAMKQGEAAVEYNKALTEKYGDALWQAYQKNYVEKGVQTPSADQIQQLNDFIAKNGADKVVFTGEGSEHAKRAAEAEAAADPWGIGASVNIGGFGIQAGGYFGWPYLQGYQCGCPFANYGGLYGYNLGAYYGCGGAAASLYGAGWGLW